MYSFHPSVWALSNKNAFANTIPFNTVNTATGSNIKFFKRSIVVCALVLAATIATVLANTRVLFNPLAFFGLTLFCLLFYHYAFGFAAFWSVRKRVSYSITGKEIVFNREGVKDVVSLASVQRAWVIPTATLGLAGYHNIGVEYAKNGGREFFFLYGAPNRDLRKIIELLARRR